MNPSCPICSTAAKPLQEQGLVFYHCPNCGHGFRTDEPREYGDRVIPITYDPDRAGHQIDWFGASLYDDAEVFEVGCASGGLAGHIRKRFNIRRYEGVEISRDAEAAAKVLTRVHRQWPEPTPAPFDLVILSHVLEHVSTPTELLGQCTDLLKPGGALFAEVPLGSGHPALPLDFNPGHLHFFTVDSLSRLASTHGLAIKKISSGHYESPRYPDSLRILATKSKRPTIDGDELGRRLAKYHDGPWVIWGAGGTAQELIAPYVDPSRIAFFVDRDPTKQGQTLMGRPIKAPEALKTDGPHVVLISSLDHAGAIQKEIMEYLHIEQSLSLSELLSPRTFAK